MNFRTIAIAIVLIRLCEQFLRSILSKDDLRFWTGSAAVTPVSAASPLRLSPEICGAYSVEIDHLKRFLDIKKK
jgi:hypothetical protein